MKDLKCGLKECRYNKGYCCCSKNVAIDSRTDCATYSPDEDKRRATFEAASDFIPANYSVDTAVRAPPTAYTTSRASAPLTG